MALRLVTSQRLLSRRERALGNSILQSGASLGAIATPIVVLILASDAPESWRLPFRVIGAIGVFWVVGWLAVVRARDLDLALTAPELAVDHEPVAANETVDVDAKPDSSNTWTLLRRLVALTVVVITINLCWQYFRAWMPGMLREQYGYTKEHVQYFSIAYYIATDIGCITVGFLTKWLVTRGLSVLGARLATFLVCALMTALSVVAAYLPASWLLLGTLLLIGFGSLGQFPTYYALTQELSAKRMGLVTGTLSFLTWSSTGLINIPIGQWIHRTHSYTEVTFLAGLLPMLGFLAILLLWNAPRRRDPA